jgi:hypothetical protein
MAVIPPDAGVRMRTQADAGQVQALAPVRAISGDLPDLVAGQSFTAHIQESLPDNTYRAMVAGRQLTLKLPEGAEAGDTLDLVLVDRTGRTLIAQRVEARSAANESGQAYPYAKISNTGQLIGQLLLSKGETPQPAPLNQGQPVLPRPPTTGADLVPALAKAVSQSGLFYESHQAQWLAGQRPIEALRAEPQGQLPPTVRPHIAAAAPALAGQSPAADQRPGEQVRLAPMAGSTPLSSAAGESSAANAALQTAAAPNIPEQVRPLVQQQLEAIVSQRLAWHGEVWPGQMVDWAIERNQVGEHEAPPGGERPPGWSTRLRLSTPQLGVVDATLSLIGNNLRVQMTTGAEESAMDLRRQVPELAQAMADAGLNLQSIEVRRET